MSARAETDAAAGPNYISTGHLPDPDEVTTAVRRAYERFRGNTEGKNSDVYPALAGVRERPVRRVRRRRPAATSIRSATPTMSSRS